eukprot:6307659-Pyramimonas_sp.AAC.1
MDDLEGYSPEGEEGTIEWSGPSQPPCAGSAAPTSAAPAAAASATRGLATAAPLSPLVVKDFKSGERLRGQVGQASREQGLHMVAAERAAASPVL